MSEKDIMNRGAKIKNIHAGKPDAKDEITFMGNQAFLDNYVLPEQIDINRLISDNLCFITGNKGTGKTAILYYLENAAKLKDESTCASFIFFRGDYSDTQKEEMEILAKRITSYITFERNIILSGTDFEYIWRWLFYRRIIEDNESFNNGLFEDNEEWKAFVKIVGKPKQDKKRVLSIPTHLTLSTPITTPGVAETIEPKIDLDFTNSQLQETSAYKVFISYIEQADDCFTKLKRTDIPYFILVDELEAYYGDDDVFKRDLRLIRDLIFTVKKINTIFLNYEATTKIVCSVRTEIIKAIYRFIIPKEVNKTISGFDLPLIWNYTTTNSFDHPIMKILLNRIAYGEKQVSSGLTIAEIKRKWFPEQIRGQDAPYYILDNTWFKPRDIVRLITAAQGGITANESSFSQATIDKCKKKYSTESLSEIKEEMLALYNEKEIDDIILLLTGYRRCFSIKELRERINESFNETIWATRMNDILRDLYRIGLIGNYLPYARTYRWQHRDDDGVILDNNWNFVIHPALTSTLSINERQDNALTRRQDIDGNELTPGSIINVIFYSFTNYFAFGKSVHEGKQYKVALHISQVDESYVNDFSEKIELNTEYQARVLRYDNLHRNYTISLKL